MAPDQAVLPAVIIGGVPYLHAGSTRVLSLRVPAGLCRSGEVVFEDFEVMPVSGHILYVMHGSQKYVDQLWFSFLTLLELLNRAQREDIGIVIYTDQPERCPVHPQVRITRFSATDLARWRGPLDFVHRVKIEILRRALQDVGAPLIYVDLDTRWLALPDVALAQLAVTRDGPHARPSFYMHVLEGALSDTVHPRYFAAMQSKRAVKSILSHWGIPTAPPWPMWNAGGIGLRTGMESFLDDALALCDELLLWLRPYAYVEQLSLSLLAHQYYEVNTLEDCVHHYWGVSAEFAPVARKILSELDGVSDMAERARICAGYHWDEQALRDSQRVPQHLWTTRFAKMRASVRKRQLDLKALWLRSLRSAS